MKKKTIDTSAVYVVMCEVASVAFPIVTCAYLSDAEHVASSLTKQRVAMPLDSIQPQLKSLVDTVRLSLAVARRDFRYWIEETMMVVDSGSADQFAESMRRAINLTGPIGGDG